MGMAGKLQIAEQMWLGGATLLAACLALYQFFVPLSSRERPEGHVAAGWPFWLTIGLIALGAAVSFIPTPAFSQYFTPPVAFRSEEHTSELQSLMRISYAGFC